jgi:hypothetical protein
MRKSYLNIISDNMSTISLTFKMAGYGIKLSGYHLLIATLVSAYFFVIVVENTIGFNTSNGFGILLESIIGGFLSLVALSFIAGVLNTIYSIPDYIMFNK